MSGGYAKVFSSLWDGTLGRNWEACSVFVYMLANCDARGIFDKTPEAIADRSHIPLEVVEKGLRVLEQPDRRSRRVAENGRRIVKLDEHRDWGWRIVNYEFYRGSIDEDEQREKASERQRKHRQIVAAQKASRAVTNGHGLSLQAEAEAEAEAKDLLGDSGAETETPEILETQQRRAEVSAPRCRLPTIRGTDFPVTEAQVVTFAAAYPAVDVMQELNAMAAWLISNPTKRKTARGMLRFVNGWLSKQQDRGPRASNGSGVAATEHEGYRFMTKKDMEEDA